MKLRDELISTTPSAKAPANSTPIAESSFTRRFVATTAMDPDVSTPKISAPQKMLCPMRNAMTMPGKIACDSASPTNESPRSTTYVPMAPVTAPMRITSISARRMNSYCSGSVR